MDFPPRVIRLKDASRYLGMDKNRFNSEVRPQLTEISVGIQGIGFDRVDLDNWFDEYKARNGRLGKRKGGKKPWRKERPEVSSRGARSGISTKSSEEEEFARALERATNKRRKST